MIIGAVNKFSLLDFPGESSCIVFTVGCDFRCGYCHNPEFVVPELVVNTKKNLIPESIFLNFLQRRKGLLTGVSICGGEPCLQKDLFDFCKKIKALGFKVKLDTNGGYPELLQKLLDGELLDYVAMDIKNPIDRYNEISGINTNIEKYTKSIEIIKKSEIEYEFRTTLVSGIHDEKSVEDISKTIIGARKYFLQNFRTGDCLDRNFSGESFGREKLEKFKKIANLYLKEVYIRE